MSNLSMPIELLAYFTAMFFTCMVCHGELVRTKPAPKHLTAFYLMTSAGGAIGGLTIGLVCPWLFSTYIEMQICMLTAAVVMSSVFLIDAQSTWLGDSPSRRAIGVLGYCFVFIFYEINPTVVEIANEDFSFLNNTQAETEVVLGDARISMESESSQQFDVLVLDAFSGDSIPTHLLTKEAFDVYVRHLAVGGVIAVHISNQHVNLEPVVRRVGAELGFECLTIVSPDRPPQWMPSKWVLMTRDDQFLATAEIREHSLVSEVTREFPLWTDQYNNIVQLLRIY